MKNSFISAPTLTEGKSGEFTVFYKDTFLYDKNCPTSNIINKINAIEVKPNTLIFIPSPLLFYGIDVLLEKLSIGCAVLCVESDQNLFLLKNCKSSLFEKCYNVSQNSFKKSKFEYVRTNNADFFLNIFEKFNFSSIRNFLFLPLGKGYLISRDFYTKCFENLKKNHSSYLKNTLTLYAFGQRYFKNIFLNIPFFIANNSNRSVSAEDVKNLFVNFPIVVVGAGESLETALPLIKKYRSGFKLIAIDTALKTLFQESIRPDYVLALESQIYNIADFIGCDFFSIPLIADMTTYPLTSKLFKGKKYYFSSDFKSSPFLNLCVKEKIIPSFVPPLGSVGVIALYIASLITSSPIFYTGLDFSFKAGKTHAKESPQILNALVSANRLSGEKNYYISFSRPVRKIKNLSGETVFTTAILESYGNSLKEIITSCHNIYSLFSCGIVENKNNIADEKQFESILLKADKANIENKSFAVADKADREKTICFLQKEYEKICIVIKAGAEALNGINSEENIARIKEVLEYSDYLIPFIPDSPSVKLQEQYDGTKLKYILLSAYKFKKTVENALKTINTLQHH